MSPAHRVCGPLTPRMCWAFAGECRKFDSIGVGVTGAPRLWPFQAMDVRGVRGGAPQVRLDRRGRHRRAVSVTFSRQGCAGHVRGSAASSTRLAWASPARRVCGSFYATDVRDVRGGAPQMHSNYQMGCVKNQGRNFTSHRRCAESGNSVLSKGRRGWWGNPKSVPGLVLL